MIARILTWLAVLAAIAVVVGAIVKGYEHWRDAVRAEGDKAGAARVQAKWDEADRARAAQAVENARQSARETLRRLDRQQENQIAQDKLMVKARSDAAVAAAAADGLRLRAETYLSAAGCSASTGDSALECIRKAVAKVADALGQCGGIARQVAVDADEAHARGLKCEADYDSLTLKVSP